jgi:hypothetical protein
VNTGQKIKNILSDPEVGALALWNGLLIVFYEREELRIATLIWLFYFQNIFIGIQYFLRFSNLENSMSQAENAALIKRSGMTMTVNDKPVDVTGFSLKAFFALHFGIFHSVYFVFLSVMTFMMPAHTFDKKYFLAGMLFMALNTFISTQSHYKSDIQNSKTDNFVDNLFKIPYLRVFPMHLFIMAGFALIVFYKEAISMHIVFFIFLLAKTVADISMHVVVNKTWQGPRPKAFGEFI